MSGTQIPISETFVSIQGEGKLTGVPSLFIRTSGCNLRCTWCDTPYASWKPDGVQRTIDSLIEEARAAYARGIRHIVLTGGEPMMFQQSTELTRRLAEMGFHITIETAGTVIPAGGVTCQLMSISPKLANSTPPASGDPRDPGGAWAKRHEERRLNVPVLQRLLDEFPGSASADRQLKFVIASGADLAEIDALLAQLRGWKPADILLMPEGTPPSPEHRDAAVRLCLERGWRYCHRLHLDLFGNVRGT